MNVTIKGSIWNADGKVRDTFQITIDNSSLDQIVKRSEPIVCNGASQKSKPTTALVQVQGVYASRDVVCPRLRTFNAKVTSQGNPVRLCFEGHPATFDADNQGQYEASSPCPYYDPGYQVTK